MPEQEHRPIPRAIVCESSKLRWKKHESKVLRALILGFCLGSVVRKADAYTRLLEQQQLWHNAKLGVFLGIRLRLRGRLKPCPELMHAMNNTKARRTCAHRCAFLWWLTTQCSLYKMRSSLLSKSVKKQRYKGEMHLWILHILYVFQVCFPRNSVQRSTKRNVK